MLRSDVPTQRNPIELVTIKGATKRKRQPRMVECLQDILSTMDGLRRTLKQLDTLFPRCLDMLTMRKILFTEIVH